MIDVDTGRFRALLHAYGWATDTPDHLRALAEGDQSAREAAVRHLWSAVIHQGTPWTVTPAVALVVAGLLGDDRLAGPRSAGLRTSLLEFLTAVAEAGAQGADADLVALAHPADRDVDAELRVLRAADPDGDESEADEESEAIDSLWEDEVLADAMYARAVLGCRQVTPELFVAARHLLTDPDPAVRSAAAQTVSVCHGALVTGSAAPTDSDSDTALARQLNALVATAGPDERAALVLALGELGLAPREHLTDPHPGVRACAALAPALADDPVACAELLSALTDPVAVDDWFRQRPPQWPAQPHAVLVAAVVERVREFDRLLPAALAIARTATLRTVDHDWGVLLSAAFPDGSGGAGPVTGAQRRYLGALVDNPELWDPTYGNASAVFSRAGLPYDRDRCRALVAAGAP